MRIKYVPFRTDAALVTDRIQDPTVKLKDSWGYLLQRPRCDIIGWLRSPLINQTGRQEKLVQRLWLCGNFMFERNFSSQEIFSA